MSGRSAHLLVLHFLVQVCFTLHYHKAAENRLVNPSVSIPESEMTMIYYQSNNNKKKPLTITIMMMTLSERMVITMIKQNKKTKFQA